MTQTKFSFQKLLVANRGEIAIRILRASSELKIRTVAIFTHEDRFSQHRYKADESYQIGADNDPLKPYLDIEEIIRVAKKTSVDAIHPGYGFLSENSQFARRCREEGITFIGPQPEVMEQIGDKIAAKKLARKAKVPLIEDSREGLVSVQIAKKEAKRIGYPVMIKAASGGGGRGMRIVRNEEELETEYKEARSESLTAFGDDTIFLEKYIENPKHIEVQLLGDKHGNLVHLYERDCSIQRRFQKVVEIAPATTLPQAVKDKLYQYALQLGKAVDYTHAGTVEFLVDQEGEVYFIEVNPRIQVEHTVTEEVTGIDIVRAQILIAMGFALDDPLLRITQEEIAVNGVALQCRVTTEDPENGFVPDYGTIIAYRSASGMGIRLDAGSAYAGARISPFFDSLLVKVTAWGRTLPGASNRMHRALREFRVRGVKTNIPFLLNLLEEPDFKTGDATVSYIPNHPDLILSRGWQNRGTKMLRYLGEVIVNGNDTVGEKKIDKVFDKIPVPFANEEMDYKPGMRDKLLDMGPERFSKFLKGEKQVYFTDTTFRDAHQSLLATRMRTYDMLAVAEQFAKKHGHEVFSMEVWGGATFDASMRFLKESPWKRLELFRKAMPNVILQMLLRASNAVGYKAYPDNLVQKFIEEAAETGIDLFRIFDSLNWVENMKTSIKTVRERTNAIAEAAICYSGDITDPSKTKFDLKYYLELAKELEGEGAHIIAIKDMAGLLKPRAAEILIGEMQQVIHLPIHLHTHDTASVQASTYMRAIRSGVNVVDVAMGSMSGLTSQPSFNSLASILKGHDRFKNMDVSSLNEFSSYWEQVRRYYYPFETELRAGSAEIYDLEIPGGQYSNLRPQARGLGLEDQFETIKQNYIKANKLFGNIIKVTPSSKVVGDMAMFMTANDLSEEDVMKNGYQLDFPNSVKSLMRGDLGQIKGGFPKDIQKIILKGEEPYTDRPNAHMPKIEFKSEFINFQHEFGDDMEMKDFLSYKLYPKVFKKFYAHQEQYGDVSILPTPAFFYGLHPNQELEVSIGPGKIVIIKFLNITEPDDNGLRLVFFHLNGQMRSVAIQDKKADSKEIKHAKANGEKEVGSPLQGSLSQILVHEGQEIEANTPLFIIEAMKMESTITSQIAGKVKKIHLAEKTLVAQGDLVIELE